MLIFYKHRRSVVMFHQTSNFSHTCLDTDFCRSRAVQNRVQFGTRHAIPKSFHVLHELDRAAVPFTFHSFKCIIQFLWRPIGSLHLVKCFIQTFGNIQQTKDITFLVAYRLLSRSLLFPIHTNGLLQNACFLTRCLKPRATIRFRASVAEVSDVTHMGPFVMICATVAALRE